MSDLKILNSEVGFLFFIFFLAHDSQSGSVRNLLILFVMLFSFFCHMQGRSTGNMFLLLDEKDHTRSKKKHDDERR